MYWSRSELHSSWLKGGNDHGFGSQSVPEEAWGPTLSYRRNPNAIFAYCHWGRLGFLESCRACSLSWLLGAKLLLKLSGRKTIPGRSHTIKPWDLPEHLGKHLKKFRLVAICAVQKPPKPKSGLVSDLHATMDDRGRGIGGFQTRCIG